MGRGFTTKRRTRYAWGEMRGRDVLGLPLASLAVAVGVCAFLWPSHAWAWGPLAHLEFSSGALESLPMLSQATRLILARYSGEFLYGSLAADIIVGKNLARYA